MEGGVNKIEIKYNDDKPNHGRSLTGALYTVLYMEEGGAVLRSLLMRYK